jgi:hypothetical protein
MNVPDHELEDQLREAMRSQTRDDPLPPGFVASLVAALPERQPRSGALRLGIQIAAAMAMILVTAVLLWVGPRPFVGTLSPSGTAQFSGTRFSFEYADTWRVITPWQQLTRYRYLEVVIGIGDWEYACTPIPSGGVHCPSPTFIVPPGGVVVQVSQSFGPGSPRAVSPDAITLPDGGLADVSDEALRTVWYVVPPASAGPFPVTIEAHFSEPNVETAKAQVRELVESLNWHIP